jgi:hypothetical protein
VGIIIVKNVNRRINSNVMNAIMECQSRKFFKINSSNKSQESIDSYAWLSGSCRINSLKINNDLYTDLLIKNDDIFY